MLTYLLGQSPAASPTGSPAGGAGNLLFLLVIVAGFYLLAIRPQRARMKAAQELIGSLQVGDEVQTAGGMFGRIRRLDDQHAWVELAPGIEIKFLRRAVVGKVPEQSASTDDATG